MDSIVGPTLMILGALVAAVLCAGAALATQRRVGAVRAWSLAGLVWSIVVIGLVTLVPANGPPGIIPADRAQTSCSFDYGGPAPDGFLFLAGGQRTLNAALFAPAGFCLAVAVAGRRTWWLVLPGLLLLTGYSAGIERTQLELTRLGRACDITDVVDNVTGAVVGALVGLVLAGLLAGRARRRTAS
jgi:hypothetical protein